MDHDLTTAPGAAAAADGLPPGGPDTASAVAEGCDERGIAPEDLSGPSSDTASGSASPAEPPGDPVTASGPAEQSPTVRLASPGSVIASIPYLFGFHPENSLVVLGVSHSTAGSFIRHGVRIGLDQVRGHERGTAMELAARLRDQDAGIAILVAYGPRAATGAKARPDHCRKLMAAFRAQLEAGASEERVTVVDALYTANGRWWSYMCRNNRCCPSAGTVVPAEAPAGLAGAFAARGHGVYASRQALEATLDPYPPETLARTAAAAERIDPTWYDTDAGLADARRLMDTLLARCGAEAQEQATRTPRTEGPRAGRRGLSDTATAALTTRPRSGDALGRESAASASAASGTGDQALDSAATGPVASRSSREGDAASSKPAAGDLESPSAESATTSSHTSSAVIPAAARASRRVTNRVPVIAGKSEGVPLGAQAEPPGSLLSPPLITDGEAAELLVALLNWRVRDYLACAAATVDSAGRLLRLGAELARRAPHPELRLAPYSLAAWAAWAISRPAIAQCAVDRALAIDPEYKFASLIRAGLHHAIDGEGVRESAASTRRDLFGEEADADSAADSADSGNSDHEDTAPDTTPASIPSPRTTEPVPTESETDLEVSS